MESPPLNEKQSQDPNSLTFEEPNPFQIPSDEDIFIYGEQEKKRRLTEKRENNKKKIWDRDDSKSNTQGLPPIHFHDTNFAEQLKRKNEQEEILRQSVKKRNYEGAIKPRQQENLTEFISKKKEMFLIEMSLETKREEIKKLEKKAKERERKIEDEEVALKKNAQKFEDFLTENDVNAVKASNEAEEEVKLKQQKILENKKLQNKIQLVKNEIEKIDEQLNNCKKFKIFLDKLTPKEWIEQEEKAMKLRREEKLARNEKLSIEDTYISLYFEHPKQLLQIFSDLEEKNLFLIQSNQEIEEQLEKKKKEFLELKEKMDSEEDKLMTQIKDLEKDIRKEEKLTKKIKKFSQDDEEKDLTFDLDNLTSVIKEVYEKKCCFGQTSDLKPLQMLTQMERKLEDLISKISKYPKDEVQKLEKAFNLDRLKQEKESKQDQFLKDMTKQQKSKKEMRELKEKGFENSIKKRPLMFKSPPFNEINVNEKKENEKDLKEKEKKMK